MSTDIKKKKGFIVYPGKNDCASDKLRRKRCVILIYKETATFKTVQ